MAKKETDAPAQIDAADPNTLDLGGRRFTHLGRQYTGVVKLGTNGPEASEIEAEGFADLTKALARAVKAEDAQKQTEQAIDAREEARRKQLALDSADPK